MNYLKNLFNKRYTFIIIIFVVSVITRMILHNYHIFTSDSVLYLKLAEIIGQGQLELTEFFKPQNIIQPGYSIIIMLFNIIINNLEISAMLVSLVSGIILCLFVYVLGTSLFNKKVGLIGGLIIALHPAFVNSSWAMLTESLFMAVFVLSIYLFWTVLNNKKSKKWFFYIGLLVGFLYLTRIVGLFVMPVFFIWLTIYWYWFKKIDLKYYFSSILLLIIGCMILVMPYLVFLYNRSGSFILTGQHIYAVSGLEKYDQTAENRSIEKRKVFSSLNEDNTDYIINNIAPSGEVKKKTNYLSLYLNLFSSNIQYNFKYFGKVDEVSYN